MGQNIFQRDPDKGGKDERCFRKRSVNLGEGEREDSPKKGKEKNKDDVDQETEREGKISIMGWH
jgi:hypothetical protein